MKGRTVYLAGSINGCTDQEANWWRGQVRSMLLGAVIIDPMRRDYRGSEDENVEAIVDGDKRDIDRSDLILANCWKPSWGTAMELHYAWTTWCATKHIIAVVPETVPVSPWLRHHSHYVAPTLGRAVEMTKKWLDLT